MQERSFTSSQALQMAGITYRQLDYWDRTGLVSPSVRPASGSGYGITRLYSLEDVVALRVARALRDCGASLQRIRDAFERVRSLDAPLDFLVMADGHVYACKDDAEMLGILRGTDALMTVNIETARSDVLALAA